MHSFSSSSAYLGKDLKDLAPPPFFPALQASVWSKNKGDGGQVPSLNPPLLRTLRGRLESR